MLFKDCVIKFLSLPQPLLALLPCFFRSIGSKIFSKLGTKLKTKTWWILLYRKTLSVVIARCKLLISLGQMISTISSCALTKTTSTTFFLYRRNISKNIIQRKSEEVFVWSQFVFSRFWKRLLLESILIWFWSESTKYSESSEKYFFPGHKKKPLCYFPIIPVLL